MKDYLRDIDPLPPLGERTERLPEPEQERIDWTHGRRVLTEADAEADLAGTPRPDNPTPP